MIFNISSSVQKMNLVAVAVSIQDQSKEFRYVIVFQEKKKFAVFHNFKLVEIHIYLFQHIGVYGGNWIAVHVIHIALFQTYWNWYTYMKIYIWDALLDIYINKRKFWSVYLYVIARKYTGHTRLKMFMKLPQSVSLCTWDAEF